MPAEKKFYRMNEIGNADLSSVKIVSEYNYPHQHFPSQIFKMINLKRLYVHRGEINEIPDEISNLTNL
jgi:hypothetical protein